MPQDFNFFSKNFGQFILLIHFEILSRHPDIDGYHYFSGDVQKIINKTFREKNVV